MNSTYAKKGFTIVELLIVIVVIAILATITIVAYSGISARAHEVALKTDLRSGATHLNLAKTESGSYPLTEGANSYDPNTSIKKMDATGFTYWGIESAFCLEARSTSLSGRVFHITEGGSIQDGECPPVIPSGGGGDDDDDGGAIPIPTLDGTPYTLTELAHICSNPANAPAGYNVIIAPSAGTVNGTSGNDIIYRINGLGTNNGAAGNDIICSINSSGSIDGGSGNDIIYAQSTTGPIDGGIGNDVIVVIGPQTGPIAGGTGDDTFYIRGTVGPKLNGNTGFNRLYVLDGGTIPSEVENINEYL